MPFGLPVSKRKDVAGLRGRIYDDETGKGLPDVRLNLSGLVAISEDDGKFAFPAVKVGTSYLSVEGSGAANGRVPVHKFPMEVELRTDSDSQVDIALSQAAILSGRIVMYKPEGQRLPEGSLLQTDAEKPER